MTEVIGLVAEINKARASTLDAGAIQSVVYITWVNLKQFPGVLVEVSKSILV